MEKDFDLEEEDKVVVTVRRQASAMKRVVTHEMIKQAVGVAEEAFWASIAKQFPEAKRGNLDITVSVPTTMQNEYAVKEWVITNIGDIAE